IFPTLSSQPRPWLIDDYDEWIEAIRVDRKAYRCMLIFCDNSGPDVILGVLPFALEFLSRGTKVILAANSGQFCQQSVAYRLWKLFPFCWSSLSGGVLFAPRPWLIDDYDEWIEAIRVDRKAYRCMLIFCDNSGPDVILGVLPFALEFLSRGTKVILAANSGQFCQQSVAYRLWKLFPFCWSSLSGGVLFAVDLVVIEGMGRAVHTNLHARFRVDCLKVAVIKNAWLARRLGGKLYSVVSKFQAVSLLSKDVSREQTPTTIAENTLIHI
ncbi:hypothetical protein AHF37_06704, partial [Paragonimus kellicotti]